MKIREALVIRIEGLCVQRGKNVTQLAYDAGVHPSTVKSIINGNSKNPGIVTIKKLCDGLEINWNEFCSDGVFVDLDQEIEQN